MNVIDSIGAFAIAVFNFAFWAFVLPQVRKNNLVRAYFGWCLFITLWSIGYGITLLGCFEYKTTLGWNRYCHAMATLIGPFFFRFAASLSSSSKSYKKWFIAYLAYGIINAILILITPFYVKGLWSFGSYIYQPMGGPAYILFTSFFVWCTLHAFVLGWRNYRGTVGLQRKQVQLFLLATGVAYSGGVSLLLQGFQIPLPSTGVYFILAYVVIISYAIHRYKFLDIPVLLKKTIVFAGLVAFVFGVFSLATFFVKEILGNFFGEDNFWVNGISIFLIVLGYDPIRRMLVNLTDKYFFQKKYDYQKLLKDASRGISKIESLHRLLSLVVHFITMKMRVKNAAILSRVKNTGSFKIEFQRGYSKNFFEYAIREDSELLRFLNEEHEAIDLQRIEQYIEAGNIKQEKGQDPRSYDFDAIKKTMAELEVVCCVPSYLGKELRNILMLGEKKSGDYFVEKDLDVLYTLAQESAIAIENARLYDEAINKSSELEDINGQLEYAKDLLMKALRDTEVANKQLQDTQAQLIHEQKMATLGRLAASVGHEVNNPLTILSMNVSRVLLKLRKNPDLKVTEIMDTFDKMEQNIGRIKAVVNTLTGLLKKSEKGKFEPLSLKLILEETLPLVQFQTYLDNLTGTEVEFDIPGNIPLIRGDLERLQEVFLNLFINAYHAMEGKQHRKIRVHAEIDPEDTDMVAIRFRDNGKGMDEETQKKIFNYRFTTKGPGKGSGLGLYMCKYIIELHGGAINVYSKLGEGTSFVIHLPSVDKKIEAKGLPSDLEQSYHTAQEEGTDQGNQASAG